MTRILIAALLLALVVAAPAAAQSDEGGSGPGVEIRAMATIAPLRADNGDRARDVYRALIPNGLTMPREPAVGVWLADLAFVAGRGRPEDEASRWLEGAVQIRVLRRGPDGKEIEGWYPIHYPVTAEFWFHAGRYVGLPKRHADAAITPQGAGWVAQATPAGTTGGPSYRMDWQPSPGADAAAVQRAFSITTAPLLALNKPLEGPDLMRVQYTIGAPGFAAPAGPPAFDPKTSKPERGLVRLNVRSDLDALQEADLRKVFPKGSSLSDLIVPEQTLPGSHAYYSVSLGSESEKIGEGGYGKEQPPKADPPSSGGGGGSAEERPAQPRAQRGPCRSRRVVTLPFRAFPRARVRSVRVSVDGRRVSARVLPRRRVRIVLRGARAGRLTVKVVAHQARGLTMTTRRTVTTCARARR